MLSSGTSRKVGSTQTDSELERVFICDSSLSGLEATEKRMKKHFPYLEQHYLLCEEELWPLRPNSVDLVVSNLSLHGNNDLGVSLSRILESLRPDGILVGHLYGKYTLAELKHAFYLAESERSGGVAAHAFQ